MTIIRRHNPKAGLFSHINFVITCMEAYPDKSFHVDWTVGLPYSESERGNLFDQLFVQDPPPTASVSILTSWPHYNYTFRHAWNLYHGDDQWRLRLNRIWSRLKVQGSVLKKAAEFAHAMPSDVVGVHIRNQHIADECPDYQAPSIADSIHSNLH